MIRYPVMVAFVCAAIIAICAAIARPAPRAVPPRLEREVAVLLCSHTWRDDRNGVTHIRHEISAAFQACVEAYNQTGIVP